MWTRWRPCCCTRVHQLLPKLLLSRQGRPLEAQVILRFMLVGHYGKWRLRKHAALPHIHGLLSIVVGALHTAKSCTYADT